MWVAVETVYCLGETATTKLKVEKIGDHFTVALEANSFALNVVDGKVENRLGRSMTIAQMRDLAKVLVIAADEQEQRARQFMEQSQACSDLFEGLGDNTCPACEGKGKL